MTTDAMHETVPSRAAPGRARRTAGVAAGIATLATAAAVAWFATRDASDRGAAVTGHDHTAMSGASSAASPVRLDAEQAARIGVTYAVASMTGMSREVRTVGQITWDERRVRAVAPKVEGWVEQLQVSYTGQLVAAGQPLLTIYSPMLVQAQEELLLARRLADDVGGGTDEARGSAADLLAAARRRLAYWDIPAAEIAAIERSGQVRRTLTLRAPAGGYVLEKNVLAGQKIMAGESLYRLADLSVIWVEGEVFEQDLAAVKVGQMVHADLQALPNEHRMGRITYIYPTLNPETRTARIRVELANPGLALKPGMYATIRIEGTSRENVTTIPRSAVLVTGERNLVFVKEGDGRLVPRDIRLGMVNDERVEVVAGLRAGETVVSSATFLIDAESNLGSALGAMGAAPLPDAPMPGGATPAAAPAPAKAVAPPDPHAGHRED